MTVSKIAVSIPENLVKHARREVAQGRAASVSAYVTAALEEKTNLDDLEQMLEQMLEMTGGPPTAAEKREADRILGVDAKRKRGRS